MQTLASQHEKWEVKPRRKPQALQRGGNIAGYGSERKAGIEAARYECKVINQAEALQQRLFYGDKARISPSEGGG